MERTARAVLLRPLSELSNYSGFRSFDSFAPNSDRVQALVCCGCFWHFRPGLDAFALIRFDRGYMNRIVYYIALSRTSVWLFGLNRQCNCYLPENYVPAELLL